MTHNVIAAVPGHLVARRDQPGLEQLGNASACPMIGGDDIGGGGAANRTTVSLKSQYNPITAAEVTTRSSEEFLALRKHLLSLVMPH